jgi:hypothetical protein
MSDNIDRVLRMIEVEGGISHGPADGLPMSPFVGSVISMVPEGNSGLPAARLARSIESLMIRQTSDSRLIVASCMALGEVSGLPMASVLKGVSEAQSLLNSGSPPGMGLTLRAAKVASSYPAISDVREVEKLIAIDRLPKAKKKEACETGVLEVGGRSVSVRNASSADVAGAAREIKKAEQLAKKRSRDEDVEFDVEGPSAAKTGQGRSLKGASAGKIVETQTIDDLSDLSSQIAAGKKMIEDLLSTLPNGSIFGQLKTALARSAELLDDAIGSIDEGHGTTNDTANI